VKEALLNRGSLAPLLIAYFAFITIGLPDGALNIAWTYIHPTFGVPFDALGVLLLFVVIGRMSITFAAGRLIAALGIRGVLLIGASLLTAGALGMSTAPAWDILLIAVLLTWLGSGALDAALNTFVSANYSVGRLNWLHAAYGVGATAGPALMTVLIAQLALEWRWGYALMIAPGVIALALFALTPNDWRVESAETIGTRHADTAGVRETLRSPLVWLGMLLFFVYGGAEIGTGQLANPLLMGGRGVDQETAGFWISMYWGMFTIGRMIMGAAADRLPVRALLRSSMIGAIIGALLLWLSPAVEGAFIGLALTGFCFAPLFAALTAETPRRVGARLAANAIGFQIGVTGLGGAVLPGAAAFIAERTDARAIAPLIFLTVLALLIVYEWMMRFQLSARRAVPASAGG
jgi:fucose permease